MVYSLNWFNSYEYIVLQKNNCKIRSINHYSLHNISIISVINLPTYNSRCNRPRLQLLKILLIIIKTII